MERYKQKETHASYTYEKLLVRKLHEIYTKVHQPKINLNQAAEYFCDKHI